MQTGNPTVALVDPWVVVRVDTEGVDLKVVNRFAQLRATTPSAGVRVPVAAFRGDPVMVAELLEVNCPGHMPLVQGAALFGKTGLPKQLAGMVQRIHREHPECVSLLAGWRSAVTAAWGLTDDRPSSPWGSSA